MPVAMGLFVFYGYKVAGVNRYMYRLLWDCNPRMVEVYPPDGSIIQSTGGSGHHFIHIFFSERSKQVSIVAITLIIISIIIIIARWQCC